MRDVLKSCLGQRGRCDCGDNDRSGVDQISWVFSDFQAGETLLFEVDVDPNRAKQGGSQAADARNVFFNNGAAANSRLQMMFNDGSSVDFLLPDPVGSVFHFEGGVNIAIAGAVPEPQTHLLLALGLIGLALTGRNTRGCEHRLATLRSPITQRQ